MAKKGQESVWAAQQPYLQVEKNLLQRDKVKFSAGNVLERIRPQYVYFWLFFWCHIIFRQIWIYANGVRETLTPKCEL